MKKYILEAGYSYRKDYDDLTHKQFTLASAEYLNSETSTLGNKRLDRIEVYTLFLKSFDASDLKTSLESILNNALAGGVNVSLDNAVSVENVENGYDITLSFYIQG